MEALLALGIIGSIVGGAIGVHRRATRGRYTRASITPIADARAGQTIVVRGRVQCVDYDSILEAPYTRRACVAFHVELTRLPGFLDSPGTQRLFYWSAIQGFWVRDDTGKIYVRLPRRAMVSLARNLDLNVKIGDDDWDKLRELAAAHGHGLRPDGHYCIEERVIETGQEVTVRARVTSIDGDPYRGLPAGLVLAPPDGGDVCIADRPAELGNGHIYGTWPPPR